ncbi:MAG: Dabb family protein [Rectinemataceae bacterium]
MDRGKRVYRHVVLFKFFDKTSAETVHAIENAFRDLKNKLPFVIGYEWGTNSSPEGLNEGYTHCFIVTFAKPEDRDAYLPHPDHQYFCKEFLDPNLEKACVVDYWAED